MQKRRKRQRRALKLSFAVTFSILLMLLVGTYAYVYLNSVPVRHLPPTVPAYEATWAKYIPNTVIQFSFQNLTYVNEINSSLPFFNTILRLSNPVAQLTTNDVAYLVSMEFKVPNASVDIAFLKPASYAPFGEKFAGLGSQGHQVGNDTLYEVADTATGKLVLGWLALIPADEAVGFAPGISSAENAMREALTVPTQANASIIGLPDIRQMLYVAGGANGHIALGVNSFTGEVSMSLKTLTAVDRSGVRLNVSRVVEFSDSSTAHDQYTTVRHAYLAATNVILFDAYVRASQLDSISKLGGDYRLVQ